MARVLVVDDEEQYLRHLSSYLTRQGHEVETARDSDSALRQGQSFDPHVLIVDWRLGDDLPGIEVARSLRRGAPGLKTIVMSGYPEELVRQSLRDDEISCLLEKPMFTLREAAAAVEAALQPDK